MKTELTTNATTITRARGQQLGDMLRRSAARVPNKTALVFGEQSDTFSQLNTIVNRTANALIARGVERGDRVALLSHNNRTFVILRFAVARIGAVLAPINFMLNSSDTAYLLSHCQPVALLVEDTLTALADEAIAEAGIELKVHGVIQHSGATAAEHWQAVEPWFDYPDSTEPYAEVGDDEPVQLMYTSGTESRPKGAMMSARSLYAQYVTCIVDGEMSENDIEVHSLPLFHCAQLDVFLMVDIYLGATSVLLEGPDPTTILSAIEHHKATKLFCPPTVWISLLRHPQFDQFDLNSLRKGYYGASIMPTAIIEEIAQRLPSVRLFNFYGQTELAPLATILKPEDQLRKLGSAGRPGINVETRLVDDDNNPVAVGEVGEIVHRSPQATLGYYHDPKKTAESFSSGWFHSGDLGRMDDEGYLYVVDRKKDMIKTGGENVASREVEEVIIKHPDVMEVAVVGIPHPRWIEAVTAFVVAKPGVEIEVESLEAFCRDKLSSYKRPKCFQIEAALPKNASGKILKRQLKDRVIDLP
ncbi:fatty acyl-CoA synthetase [Halioxenophilus sp. WMMB6]|uniref:fatty acyl-CoA synthetase n=1 Tax=Halioxenophilus sp. WMMB6 TaxID=3073815 RepID=UPI00295E32F7|nr:fatty acyl-CoA synthetase [Halioxenophilus sp. WMMB6]